MVHVSRAGTGPAARRADHHAPVDPPVLDEDGLLRYAGCWVSISDAQIPLVDLLVRNTGQLVTRAQIHAAYTAAGGSGSATSLRSVVHRLGRRVAVVGLALRVVRGQGVVLDAADRWW